MHVEKLDFSYLLNFHISILLLRYTLGISFANRVEQKFVTKQSINYCRTELHNIDIELGGFCVEFLALQVTSAKTYNPY